MASGTLALLLFTLLLVSEAKDLVFLTPDTVEQRLSHGTWIVMVGSDKCGRCQSIRPHFIALKRRYRNQIKFAEYDCRKPGHSLVCYNKFKINGYPGFYIYNDGVLVDKYTDGRKTKELLDQFIQDTLRKIKHNEL